MRAIGALVLVSLLVAGCYDYRGVPEMGEVVFQSEHGFPVSSQGLEVDRAEFEGRVEELAGLWEAVPGIAGVRESLGTIAQLDFAPLPLDPGDTVQGVTKVWGDGDLIIVIIAYSDAGYDPGVLGHELTHVVLVRNFGVSSNDDQHRMMAEYADAYGTPR